MENDKLKMENRENTISVAFFGKYILNDNNSEPFNFRHAPS